MPRSDKPLTTTTGKHDMKTSARNYIAMFGLLVGAVVSPAGAATFTWSGAGETNEWNAGANWIGNSVSFGSLHHHVFSGTTRPTSVLGSEQTLNGLVFAPDAGAFTLDGAALYIAGSIVNQSSHLQTIGNEIKGSTMSIDTGKGGIRLTGILSNTNVFNKNGMGTLTLEAGISGTRTMNVNNGRLELHLVGSSNAASAMTLGNAGSSRFAALELIGAGGSEFRVTGQTTVGNGAAITRIILTSTSAGGITYYGDGSLTRSVSGLNAPQTLNLDISSSADNRFYYGGVGGGSSQSNPTGNNKVLLWATITTLSNGERRTWFASEIDGTEGTPAKELVALTTAVPLEGTIQSGQDYAVFGTQSIGNGTTTLNSLTITGEGSLDGGTLNTRGVLMQEGTGDYTISTQTIGQNNGAFFIHQYSEDGVLTIHSTLFNAGTTSTGNNSRLVKTGAGTVVLAGTSRNMFGAADVGEGRLILNGTLGTASRMVVWKDATLAGSGAIGGQVQETEADKPVRYTPVYIYTGGTLDGTPINGKALSIVGSLTFEQDAAFSLNITTKEFTALSVSNITPEANIVTLDGDLKLTLGYEAQVGDRLVLLAASGGNITGTFATVNGQTVEDGHFVLNYNEILYHFELQYTSSEVAILATQVIPEPGTFALVACGALLGARAIRRRGEKMMLK